ncbi:MAG: hypothetical protein ACQETL_05900 [Bacteroidota bacterium]
MNEYLQNYNPKFFGKLYKTIKEYYPLNKENSNLSDITETSEYKKRINLITHKLHDRNEYKFWVNFIKQLNELINKEVKNINLKQQPSFNGEINIETSKYDNIETKISLIFSISLLGPYYSIMGVENLRINREQSGEEYNTSLNDQIMAFASPTKLLNPHFEILRTKIKEEFPEYKQVPYNILKLKIKGLNSSDESVYKALFNGTFSFPKIVRGDKYYPINDWRNDSNTKGWQVNPPV